MHGHQKLIHELKALTLAMLYFGSWLGVLLLLKKLILAEYQIQFSGLSIAFVGALILSKVVLILEHVPLGRWLQSRPAWIDVLFRTVVYSLGVLVVLLLEKAFEGRHESGGFVPALMSMFRHAEIHHVWVNTIVLSGALLTYNAFGVIKHQLGVGGLGKLFMSPLREAPPSAHSEDVSARVNRLTNQ